MGENMTTFVDGQVLTAAELNSAFAAPAANLAGGVAGQIPYQTAASTTSFIGAGTAGQVLVSQGGTSAPVFESTLSGLTFNGSAFNGTVGATTPSTGAFTTLSSNSTTTLGATSATSLNSTPIGSTTPSTGAFTTLSSNSTTTLGATTATSINSTPIGNATPSTGAFTTATASTSVLSPIVGAGTASNLSLWSNGVTHATLDTSGNLGLGVTPSAWGSNFTALQLNASVSLYGVHASSYMGLGSNFYVNSSGNAVYNASDLATSYVQGAGQHIWNTAPSGTAGNTISFTQAMTLTNSGSLLVGWTGGNYNDPGFNGVQGISLRGIADSPSIITASTGIPCYLTKYTTSSGGFFIAFDYSPSIGTSGTNVGSVSTNGTSTSYNTTSDQRLKTDLGLASQSRILDVKIHDYEWKSDGSKARGVFAQEAHQVIPEAVSVGSDEVDENGNLTKPWAVDYSKFIPDLIVQVQEQQEMINQLKAEIAELKGAK